MNEKKIKITKNHAQYIPLFNKKGLKSSITPFFGGDIKLDHHHYLLEPTTELDLYQNNLSRNIIFTIDGSMYFLNGNTSLQQNDEVTATYGLLYQKVERINKLFTLNTLSFITLNDDIEVLKVEIKNTSSKPFLLDTITAIPIYARSADNLRDHRHVTSLLNRVSVAENGILVRPSLSFDERGHKENHHTYSVFAYQNKLKVTRMITTLEDFLDGGSFSFPKGIYKEQTKHKDGYEVIAGIGFEKTILKPDESLTFIVTMGIFDEGVDAKSTHEKYQTLKQVDDAFNEVVAYFNKENEKLKFELFDKDTSTLLEWVRLQPVFRRFFGNSYLPHHDYGRGGRGWRDLWQDLLSLIMFNDKSVESLLLNNFQGVRIDGSNATIIGDKPGEFLADRNKIVRVWSDHGAWPLLTVLSYINQTGDLSFLFKKQYYFDDQFTHYTNKTKDRFSLEHILENKGLKYQGTVLEHLLLQNVIAHFNVGENGFIKLENADWNDGLDMAKKYGETIAFTHFYAKNLERLAKIIKETNEDIYLFESLKQLIFEEITLDAYFIKVSNFDEDVIQVDKNQLVQKLELLCIARIKKINETAWINNSHLQSYVTENKVFLDNNNTMNLTGQAMALLNETLTIKQAKLIANKTKELLFNKDLGGYHLNTDYKELKLDLGRAFGFAYNHKENGGIFSHMAIMYVYGLYNYGLVKEGNEGYKALIQRAINPDSYTLLGIPEYFTDQGVGKYLYLTGSASWLLKLLIEQVFGIKYTFGRLSLEPKLVKDDFIDGKASIQTYVRGNLIKITYVNENNLDYGEYKVSRIISQEKEISIDQIGDSDILVYLDAI